MQLSRSSLLLLSVLGMGALAGCTKSPMPLTQSGTVMETSSGVTTFTFFSSSSSTTHSGSMMSSSSTMMPASSSSVAAAQTTVTIEQQIDRTELHPSDEFTVTIVVKNTGIRATGELTLENAFPPNKVSILDVADGQVMTDRISWNIPALRANETKTVRVKARVNDDLQPGEALMNIVTVRSPFLSAPVTNMHEYTIKQRLPNTGVSDYTKPLQYTPYLTPIND